MSDDQDRREPEHDPEDAAEPLVMLAFGVFLYGALVIGALLWLSSRDRLGAIAELSIGARGLLAGSGVGLVVGLVGAALADVLSRRVRGLEQLRAASERLFVRWDERVGVAFSLLAAFAEELFFRLAVQDAWGLLAMVALCVLLHMPFGGLRWLGVVLVHALTLGLLVELGFGLLGATTAHAILNYLSLRRIQLS